jgi:hypothetical protein
MQQVVLSIRKQFIFLLWSLFCGLISFGQNVKWDNLALRADVHTGYLLPEYQMFNQLANDYIYSAEFSIQKQTNGERERDQLFNYPEFGVTFLYTTLGNKEAFGNEAALFGYFLTHFVRRERFQFNQQFGLGLGYATRIFDLENNYMNVAVGSHFNLHFNYKLGVSMQVGQRVSLNSGLSFNHYSNANMAEPNLGVNFLTAYLGTHYTIGNRYLAERRELDQHQPLNEFAFIYAAGGKHTRALQSTIYFTSSFSAEYKRHVSRKIRLGGGLDLFYDSSTEIEMSAPGKDPYRPINDLRTGLHLSQEIAYGPFSFILQEGVYVGLTNKVDKSKKVYTRGIVRCKINTQFLVQVTMKSHFHILDYPEIGFGYYFKHHKT